MKRWWVKLPLALVVFGVLLWLSFLGSGVKSKNSVERYKDQLRAQGEKIDVADIIPPTPAGSSNATALFEEASHDFSSGSVDALSTNSPSPMKMIAPGKAMIAWQQPFVQDGGNRNSWEEIAAALATRSNGIALLNQFPDGGRLHFGMDYSNAPTGRIPKLAEIKTSAQLLSWNALLQIQASAHGTAATNLHRLLTIAKGYDDERLLISELIRMAICSIAQAAQWEFLQATNVPDEQLILLQEDWNNIQFIAPMENAFLMERATATQAFQYLRKMTNRSALYGLWASPPPPSPTGWLDGFKELADSAKTRTGEALWRDSWSFDDELYYLQGVQVIIETLRQIGTNGVFQIALRDCERKLLLIGDGGKMEKWIRQTLEANGYISVESVRKPLEKVLAGETGKQLVLGAIAIKRFELRHRTLPENLNALVPEFVASVPRDPVDGNPLRYRRNSDRSFLLYSIGKDGVDDGGDAANASSTSRSFYWQQGRDWVWPQPATPAEVQFHREREAQHE